MATSATALLFSTGVGLGTLSLPLLALKHDFTGAQIGTFVAVAAVVQIVTRASLGVVMRRVPDRTLVISATVAQTLSMLVVLVTTSAATLAAAWMIQGVARACFWTGGQAHVVRGKETSMRSLALLNLTASIGQLIGPALAGFLSDASLDIALVTSAAFGVAAFGPACALDRFPPFTPIAKSGRSGIWRRPGVGAGCWAGAVAGAWRCLMDSFVPVALQSARQSASAIGLLVSTANGAAMVGAVIIARTPTSAAARTYVLGMLAAGAGLAGVGYGAPHAAVAAAMLALAGLGAGTLQTLGPAIAATAVHPEERGDAIALAGTLRAVAMFMAPLGVSGLLVLMPLAPALLLAGVALSIPSVAARSLRPHAGRRDGSQPT